MATASSLKTLTADHLAYLAGEGISATVAEAHQTYSALSRADMPAELAWAWDGSGIIFTHFLLSGATVPQYRPDAPTKKNDSGDLLKYLFPSGIQNGPFVSPLQADFIASGSAKKGRGVEGTKGYLAYVSMLEASGALGEILAVGLPGCWGGVQEGLASPDFHRILPMGIDYASIFDGDVAHNPDVWAAADRHKEHVDGICIIDSKVVVLPASAKNGISDYLGISLAGMDPVRQLGTIEMLIKKARAKMPRKPAARKPNNAARSAGGAKVFWDEELIAAAVTGDDGEKSGEHFLDAAVRPVAIRTEFDDLNPASPRSSTFDLEVKTGGAVYSLNRVSSTGLDKTRTWLTQLPYGIGETITMKPKSGEDIAEAIRTASGLAGVDLPVLTSIKRSGWYTRDEDGVPVTRYVAGNLAIGPDDSVEDLTGNITDRAVHGLIFEDPHTLSDAECGAAIVELLRIEDEVLIDQAPWTMGLGMHFRAVGGGTRTGGLILTGKPGCGKTVLLRALAGLQSRGCYLDTFEGTTNAVAGLGRGLHHAVKHVDDFRDRTAGSHRSKDAQRDAFSGLCRRMLGGSEGVRGRERVNHDTGEVVAAVKESAEPMFIVTAELAALPVGKGSESDMERTIAVVLSKESTFRPGGAAEIDDIARSGILHRANVAFIRKTASVIAGAFDGSFEAYSKNLDGMHGMFQAELADRKPEVNAPRRYEVAANVLVGYALLISAAKFYGAISDDEARRREATAMDVVAEAMVRHHRQFLGGAQGHEASAIDALVSAVASGKYVLEGGPEVPVRPGTTRLGWASTLKDGSSGIVLLPEVAMEITGYSRQSLNVALEPSLIPQAGGGYTRKCRMDNGTVSAYFVTAEAWGGNAAGAEVVG